MRSLRSLRDGLVLRRIAPEPGQEIELGNTRITVLYTPGHTPESVSLVVTDLRRGTDPWFVLTGDTLFVGTVGRPDFPGRARENAGELYDSIHTKLLALPDDLEVYPGHLAGSACGAGMSGKPSSTIAFEKRWNQLGPRFWASAQPWSIRRCSRRSATSYIPLGARRPLASTGFGATSGTRLEPPGRGVGAR